MKKIIVTGGAGFIGSEFVRCALDRGHTVAVVDKLTYAGDKARLASVHKRFEFYKCDICNQSGVRAILAKEKPDALVHFAAETHVDRSILDSSAFLKTNVNGTHVLLEASRKQGIARFIHISTDEVYGEIESGRFKEDYPLSPNSPYAASKAAADLLVKSYVRTYGFPAVIVRASNNYGPWQYPEKLVPVVIYKALKGQRVPVYAKGLNIREWLYVSDCARAILTVLSKGTIGEVYNVGSGFERKNIETVKTILKILGRPSSLIEFVKDRPGHDIRYSLDFSKARSLGFIPEVSFDTGMNRTVQWYMQNLGWLNNKVRRLADYWEKVYKIIPA